LDEFVLVQLQCRTDASRVHGRACDTILEAHDMVGKVARATTSYIWGASRNRDVACNPRDLHVVAYARHVCEEENYRTWGMACNHFLE
jgi:hypothetical protein